MREEALKRAKEKEDKQKADHRLKMMAKQVQVADIQFGRFFRADDLLMEMQEQFRQMQSSHQQIEKQTSNPRKAMYKMKRDIAKDKLANLTAEYDRVVLDNQSRKAGAKIENKDFIEDISYVWITFTDNDIAQKMLSLFRKETQIKKAFRFICCKKSRVREVVHFGEQELDLHTTVEPD